MASLLPAAASPEAFDRIRRDEALLRPGVDAICARHRSIVRGEMRVSRFSDGSLPVYAVGDGHVVKLYPPCFAGESDTESAALNALAGRLPVATPELLARGELDGWRYLFMTRLLGDSLATRWCELSPADRLSLVTALGECLATMHGLDARAVAVPRPDWTRFIAEQSAACAQRQRNRGLSENWVAQIPAFLASVDLSTTSAIVFLHTEVMREHLLVAFDASGQPRLSGLFDFEPAMIGAAEYELASVGLFVTCGDAGLLRALLRGYGRRDDELGPALQRRLMAYALLHRYSKLSWYLERIPPGPGVTTLDQLAAHWWAL